MVLSIGEILVDMIEGKEKTFQMFMGGAPFNVAVNARQCGVGSAFIGRTGQDIAGNFINEQIKLYNLTDCDIQIDSKRNTTLAFVSIDKHGEREFTFFRHDTADFNLEIAKIDFNKYKNLKIVHLGSLMLSEKKGIKFAKEVVKKIRQNNLIFSFDVNFRYDLYENKKEANKAYMYFIERADILKFSAEEILDYTGKDTIEKAVLKLNNKKILLVTMGGEGSCFSLRGGDLVKVSTIKVVPVDTTGAGDAFYGAILAGIEKEGYENLNNEKMFDIVKNANIKGAQATQHKGAVKIGE